LEKLSLLCWRQKYTRSTFKSHGEAVNDIVAPRRDDSHSNSLAEAIVIREASKIHETHPHSLGKAAIFQKAPKTGIPSQLPLEKLLLY
jgi:hypothetical protein